MGLQQWPKDVPKARGEGTAPTTNRSEVGGNGTNGLMGWGRSRRLKRGVNENGEPPNCIQPTLVSFTKQTMSVDARVWN